MKLPGTRETLLTSLAAALIAGPAWAKAPPAPLVPLQETNGPQADFPVVVGAPYQIGGVTFVPSDSMNFDSVGYASVGTEGGASVSVAHHTLPVPSYAEVTDIKTGRTILVRVERRGPMDGAHAVELSPGAAAQLGVAAGSNTAVRVRRVNPAESERAMLRSGNPAPERMPTPKPLLDVLQRKLNPALVQRALDIADEDAGPAKQAPVTPAKPAPAKPAPVAPTPKPVPATKAAPKPAPAAPVPAQTSAGDVPPKGYIPSVPAATMKPAEPKPTPKAKTPPAQKTEPAKTVDSVEGDKHPDTGKVVPAMTIQAGAFSDKARAQAVADKIGGSLTKAGAMWRVRTGPYTTHASAEAALAKVKSAGYSGARIQRAE
jgi:rare lipoprotein A